MNYDIWDLKEQFERATTLDQIERDFSAFLKQKGFDQFFYHYTYAVDPKFQSIDNFPIRHFPMDYLAVYLAEGHIAHDAVHAALLKTRNPVFWSAIDQSPLSKEERNVTNVRRDAKLAIGATIPIINGNEIISFTLAADQSKGFNRLFKTNYGDLYTALFLLNNYLKKQDQPINVDLTPLQFTTLQWVAV